jgi:hypothetical protein
MHLYAKLKINNNATKLGRGPNWGIKKPEFCVTFKSVEKVWQGHLKRYDKKAMKKGAFSSLLLFITVSGFNYYCEFLQLFRLT